MRACGVQREAHAAQKKGRFVRSNTFSTWALSLIGLAVFWLVAGSLTAETVRLHPFLLLFSYQLYYFSAGLFAPQGNFEVGPWALRRARVLLGLYAACGLASLALYALCGAGHQGPAALAAQFLFGLGTAPFGGGLLWLVPSTLWRSSCLCCCAAPSGQLVFAVCLWPCQPWHQHGVRPAGPGGVPRADGALRYLIYYALGAVAAAFVQKTEQGKCLFSTRPAPVCAGGGLPALALAAFCFWFGTGWATGRLGGQFLLVQACNFVFALMGIAGMALVALCAGRLRLCAALGRATGAVLGLGGALALCADTRLRLPWACRAMPKASSDAGTFCGHLCAVRGAVAPVPQKAAVVFGAGE